MTITQNYTKNTYLYTVTTENLLNDNLSTEIYTTIQKFGVGMIFNVSFKVSDI